MDWTPQELGLLGTSLAATYVDDQSTKGMLKRGGEEKNPILGKHPSGGDIDKEFIVASALGTAIANAVPHEYRSALLGGWTALEGSLADQNMRVKKDGKKQSFGQVFSHPAFAAALGAGLGAAGGSWSGYINSTNGDKEAGVKYERKF